MKIHIIGVPMDLGAGRRGVDVGPSAVRIAGVADRLRVLGHTVFDDGDIPTRVPEFQRIQNENLKYLPEVVRTCTLLAAEVNPILDNRNQSAEFSVELVYSAFGKKII